MSDVEVVSTVLVVTWVSALTCVDLGNVAGKALAKHRPLIRYDSSRERLRDDRDSYEFASLLETVFSGV